MNINIEKFVEELGLDNQIQLDEIPMIDLYMDQVIQLFENNFNRTKRDDKEKILTKTMINNYAKGELFFPIKNKKYSREHIILISLIYQLKGALSINDIKKTLQGINEKVVHESFQLEQFYDYYLQLTKKNIEQFKGELNLLLEETTEVVNELADKDTAYIESVLLIATFANMSNLYRRVAEKLVDQLENIEVDVEK